MVDPIIMLGHVWKEAVTKSMNVKENATQEHIT
jgi:hypothetical protein